MDERPKDAQRDWLRGLSTTGDVDDCGSSPLADLDVTSDVEVVTLAGIARHLNGPNVFRSMGWADT
jgi:hypothetical protein